MNYRNRRTGKIAVSLAAGLLTAGLATSVQADTHSDRENRFADRMAERLELSTDQQAALEALLDAHRDQMRAIEWRDEEGQRIRGARRDAREARQALNEEITEILDPEQTETFAAMQEQRKHRGARHMARQLRKLDLSEEQRATIRTLVYESREQQTSRSELREQIAEVLTTEQQERLEQMRKNRGSGYRRSGRSDS